MKRRNLIAHATLISALVGILPHSVFAETTNRSPYNPRSNVEYEEIYDFEVKSFPLLMSHPNEIVIPSTTLGQVIACRIYSGRDVDASSDPKKPGFRELFAERPEGILVNRHTGSHRDMQFVDSGGNETHLYFSQKISDATFRCFNAFVGR